MNGFVSNIQKMVLSIFWFIFNRKLLILKFIVTDSKLGGPFGAKLLKGTVLHNSCFCKQYIKIGVRNVLFYMA